MSGWTEVNLVLAADDGRTYPNRHFLAALQQIALPVADTLADLSGSWHYGYYHQPGDGPGPHIRLRLLWKDREPAGFGSLLDDHVRAARPAVTEWYRGRHGVEGYTYDGEEAEYGAMWESTYLLWQAQSQWALTMLGCRQDGKLTPGEGNAPPGVGRHWERAVHMASNRLGLPYSDEVLLALGYAAGYLGALSQMQGDRAWQVWSHTLAVLAFHVADQVADQMPPGPLITPGETE